MLIEHRSQSRYWPPENQSHGPTFRMLKIYVKNAKARTEVFYSSSQTGRLSPQTGEMLPVIAQYLVLRASPASPPRAVTTAAQSSENTSLLPCLRPPAVYHPDSGLRHPRLLSHRHLLHQCQSRRPFHHSPGTRICVLLKRTPAFPASSAVCFLDHLSHRDINH